MNPVDKKKVAGNLRGHDFLFFLFWKVYNLISQKIALCSISRIPIP